MKNCKICNLTKELTEFNLRKNRGTLDSYCKSCRSEYYKQKNYDRKNYQKNYKRQVTEERVAYVREFIKPRRKQYRSREQEKVPRRIYDLVRIVLRYKQVKKTKTKCEILGWSKEDFIEKVGAPDAHHDIDHKIPVSWFVKDTPVNVINSLDNLQLLPHLENISKRNRYCHPVNSSYYPLVCQYLKREYISRVKILL